MKWSSRAPANTMILGEHSVVYGHPALACALNQFITIHWQAREDKHIHIHSALAEHVTCCERLADHPKLRFVMAALQRFQADLKFGLDITINSEFSPTIGLGSSAAVLAAMLDGLNDITQKQLSLHEKFALGHQIIITIQGRGSGTDLAASLAGGLILFQPHNPTQTTTHPQAQITKLPQTMPLTLIYSGYKTPTAQVLAWVAEQWQNRPESLAQLYAAMGHTTTLAVEALAHGAWQDFYAHCDHYQNLMTQLGVNDAQLEQLIQTLRQCPSIHSAKISGSGLGDCVLGLGNLSTCPETAQQILQNFPCLEVAITAQGALTETTL